MIKYDLVNRTYTYIAPEGSVILKITNEFFAAHWDSGWPDKPALGLHYWDAARPSITFEKVPVGDREFTIFNGEVIDYTHPNYYSSADKEKATLKFIPPVVNATQDDQDRHAAWDAVNKFLKFLQDAATSAHHFVPGLSEVEVIKGRKVPKGRYEVLAHKAGQYGPYVNLRDKSGKEFKYVNVGNVRPLVTEPVIDSVREANRWLRPDVDPTTSAHFKAALLSSPDFNDRLPWLTLADYIEETETLPAQVGDKIVAVYFAQELRRQVGLNVRLNINMYDLEYHNELQSSGRY